MTGTAMVNPTYDISLSAWIESRLHDRRGAFARDIISLPELCHYVQGELAKVGFGTTHRKIQRVLSGAGYRITKRYKHRTKPGVWVPLVVLSSRVEYRRLPEDEIARLYWANLMIAQAGVALLTSERGQLLLTAPW